MEMQPRPWYTTRAGKIFVTLLVIFLLLILGFFALTGYYIWIEKKGSTEERATLRQQLLENFTVVSEQNSGPKTQSQRDAQELIYPYSPVLGNAEAPVTILAFIDFECPFCQQAFPVFQQVIEDYRPAIRVVFKHFPAESIHPNALHAALAAQCAHDQQKFWEYHNLLFQQQRLDDDSLFTYAQNLGLNQSLFTACFGQNKYIQYIEQDILDGANIGVRGTPTYIVNNQIIEGAISKEAWDKIILDALRSQ